MVGNNGVVWCGVVWCGVVWCGVVWCGDNGSQHSQPDSACEDNSRGIARRNINNPPKPPKSSRTHLFAIQRFWGKLLVLVLYTLNNFFPGIGHGVKLFFHLCVHTQSAQNTLGVSRVVQNLPALNTSPSFGVN